MAQRIEVARQPAKRKIGPRSLRTLRQITERMRRIICAALNGDLDGAEAFRLVRMLERLRFSIASSDYEDRLEALEAHAGVRGGRVRERSNRHYEEPADYEHGDDFDHRPGVALQPRRRRGGSWPDCRG